MKPVHTVSFLLCFLLPLSLISGKAIASSDNEKIALCEKFALARPTAETVGLLGLEWQMNRAEIERVLGSPIPDPLVVEKIEDLTAPLNIPGVEARIGVNFSAEGVSEVTLHYDAEDSWGLVECLTAFSGMPREKKVFQGSRQTVTTLRMFSDDATATFMMYLDGRQVLTFARLITAEPRAIAAEELDALAPGAYLKPVWADRVMIVVRRSVDTVQALREKGVRPEEQTFFQWLAGDAQPSINAALLAHPELRSEHMSFGVYELLSPERGCYISPVTEDGVVVRLHDPCTNQDFDLAGRSFSKPIALTVPPHYYDGDGNLVIGDPGGKASVPF